VPRNGNRATEAPDEDAASVKLEKLVAEIHRELDPTAVVRHNVMMPGLSGASRQIDVLIESTTGPFTLKIVVDAKDHARPIDIKGVETFIGMRDDVQAHQGSMVCPKGFTRNAKARAEKANVALFTLVDTAQHKWQTAGISLPAICEFREASAAVSVSIRPEDPTQAVILMMPPAGSAEVVLLDEARRPLGTMIEATVNRWNQGGFPPDVGEHNGLDVFPDQKVFWNNQDGTVTRVYIHADLKVVGWRFYGNVPLADFRGLRDAQTGRLHTNGFATGLISPQDVLSKWERLDGSSAVPLPEPALSFVGFARMSVQPS